MPATKHTATGPNGELFTRTSKTRHYTHVAIGRPSYAHAVAIATSEVQRKNDRHSYRHYASYIDGTSQFLVRNSWERDADKYEQRKAAEIARAVEALGDSADADAYHAMKTAERMRLIEAGKEAGRFDRFVALGWSSRHDLAVKVAAAAGLGFAETRVIEVRAEGVAA